MGQPGSGGEQGSGDGDEGDDGTGAGGGSADDGSDGNDGTGGNGTDGNGTDGGGGTPPAKPPQVDAGADRQLDEGVQTQLNGTAMAQEDRAILRTLWTQTAGPSAEIMGQQDQDTLSLELPQVETDTVLTFRFTATDTAEESASDTVDITVLNVLANALPTVNAGDDQLVDGQTTVQLSGAAGDSDGSIASVQWTPLFSAPALTLDDADTLTPRFVAPKLAEQTTLAFELEATDDAGARAADTVRVTVRASANIAPVIDSAEVNPAVAFEGETVRLLASVSDADNDPLLIQWSQADDAAPRVAIQDADTNAATVILPDADGMQTYTFTVQVSDSLEQATRTVTVDVGERAASAPPPEDCALDPVQTGCPLAAGARLFAPGAFDACQVDPASTECPISVLVDADPGLAACLDDPSQAGCQAVLTNMFDPSYVSERIPPEEPAHACNPLYSDSYRHFVGGVHEHTAYSDGALRSRPADVGVRMVDEGHDYVIVTDHSDGNDLPLSVSGDCASPDLLSCVIADDDDPQNSFVKWAATLDQADAVTSDQFAMIRGFEWTSDRFGHINVIDSANFLNAKTTSGYAVSMTEFWQWFAYPAAFGGGGDGLLSFNHPGREDQIEDIAGSGGGDPNYAFNDFRYVPSADYRAVGLEVFGKGSEYDSDGPGGSWLSHALDKGWHVGVVGSEDHHGREWGDASLPKTVLVARSIARGDLREALLARRTYAVAQHFNDLRMTFTIDDAPFGSRIVNPAGTELPVSVQITRRGTIYPAKIELVSAGNTVLLSSEDGVLTDTFTMPETVTYLFVRASDPETGRPVAFGSPIWMLPGETALPACPGPAAN